MIKYFVYARKSRDKAEEQVMSINGQLDAINNLARKNGFVIAQIFKEEKSAKKPGRPIFNEMMERIRAGEANGIICWKLNRLARNPVDGGAISWALQTNIIQAIHSVERTYLPTDNVLMMQIDFGIATQFIKDLSSDTKRGLRDKAKLGWNPKASLPMGYLHNPKKQLADEQIICDPERYSIIKELWKRMETGAYSVLDIRRMARVLGLVNKKGKEYSLNAFYLMFRNPMYYGKFYWKDENGNSVLWEGKHKKMIDEVTFHKVQQLICDRNQNKGAKSYFFPYRGLISCGECGGHVTAERKIQAICTKCSHKYSIRRNEVCPKCNTSLSSMNNPSIIDITYYRCMKNRNQNCTQKTINANSINQTIQSLLENISIPRKLHDWLMQRTDAYYNSRTTDQSLLINSLKKKLAREKQKLENLIELRVSGEINKEEAETLKLKYNLEIKAVEEEIFQKEKAQSIEKRNAEIYLKFAKNCVERFKNGDDHEKKAITAFFISNLTLLDKTLYFSTKKAPEVLSLMQKTLLSEISVSNLKSC
ncbi:MAG: recombinase family protein [bacterium]|nr:recombinase family protein [bacterium]